MIEPEWLTTSQILEMHARQLRLFGGPSGLRDAGALDSALGRAVNKWAYEEGSLEELAAAYAFGIARNHPFVDGNKRSAFLAMATFLALNGSELDADPEEATAAILALAAGELAEDQLARWIRDNFGPRQG